MYLTSYIKSLTGLLTILTLTTLVSVNSLAETATSGNLLPNAGDGHNLLSQSSNNTTLDSMGSSNGFTLNGITDYTGGSYNELEAQGTGTVSATGSLVDLNLITDQAQAHTTTNTSLDGGVTLTSITEIQNCEWAQSSYRCGQSSAGGGQRDSFSTTIKILDENNNVLAITTLTRNNDAGYRNDSYTYTDTATYTDTGSRNWSWEWQGVDGGDPSNTGAIGPNLLGASLTATLLNVNYTPISEETEEQIEDTNELLEEAQLELENILENMEEVNLEQLEELQFETPILQELEIEEITFEELAISFEETFKEILIEENLMPTFETALIEENLTEEEFFEETTSVVMEELKEEFELEEPPKMSMKEELNEETTLTEEMPKEEMKEEEIKEEEIKEEKPKEESNESTEPETNTNEEIKEESNETTEERETGESVSNESEVAEDKETEGQQEKEATSEDVEDKTIKSTETKTASIKESSITLKVQKVLDKVLSKLKRVDQKLQAIQLVTSKGITSGEADLSGYINKRIYTNQVALNGVPNPDFFQNLNILEQQQIYKDANLAAYVSNDPIAVKQKLLQEINVDKQRLLLELRALKNEG